MLESNEVCSWTIKDHVLEYIDNTHTYLVDGLIVPSITQLIHKKFNKKYEGVDSEVLRKASIKGTYVHQAIQDYEQDNIDNLECTELHNYKFLKKQYKWECLSNEIPVIIFKDNVPVCAGRLDIVMKINNEIGLADIKRTSTLDKDYLAYQLNLYRIGYQQCYDTEIKFLRGIHLREQTRKFVVIPINEKLTLELLNTIEQEEIC